MGIDPSARSVTNSTPSTGAERWTRSRESLDDAVHLQGGQVLIGGGAGVAGQLDDDVADVAAVLDDVAGVLLDEGEIGLIDDGLGEAHDAEQGAGDLVGDAGGQGADAGELLRLDELRLQLLRLVQGLLQLGVLLLEVREQLPVLERHPPLVEGLADLLADVEDVVERLEDIVERVELHRRDGGLDGGVAGDDDDLRERIALFGDAQQLHPRQVREVLVGEQDIAALLFEDAAGLLAAARRGDPVGLLLKDGAEDLKDDRLVVDDEQVRRRDGVGGGHVGFTIETPALYHPPPRRKTAGICEAGR